MSKNTAIVRLGKATSRSEDVRRNVIAFINKRFTERKTPLKKHARLMRAILATIESGVLGPGDQLPPEPEIAAGTGLSTGTVRRCMSQLADDGIVSREHGRGTFIASQSQSTNSLWHLRFLAEDGQSLLPVYTRVIFRDLINKLGPWTKTIGKSEHGYVRILRAANVDSRFLCCSDFYVAADRFGSLAEATAEELEGKGIKNVIADRFLAPTVRVEKSVKCLPIPAEFAEIIGADTGDFGMRVQIVGYSYNNDPITYQVIWVPPVDIAMDIGTRPNISVVKRKG